MKAMTAKDFQTYADRQDWTWAKTYQDSAPHWYIAKKKGEVSAAERAEFEAAFNFILAHAEVQEARGREWKVYFAGGYKYWVMDDSADSAYIINRNLDKNLDEFSENGDGRYEKWFKEKEYEEFDRWNKVAQKTQARRKRQEFRKGQVWWCSLGMNIGMEENGKGDKFARPVLILRKFTKDFFFGLPLTSIVRDGNFYYTLPVWNEHKGQAILAQGRVLSQKRLLRYMYELAESKVDEIERKFERLLREKAKPQAKLGESRWGNPRLRSNGSKSRPQSQAKSGNKSKSKKGGKNE